MKRLLAILITLSFTIRLEAQSANCTFKPPFYTIHFGSGNVRDLNAVAPAHYERVSSACPTDGHYAYIPSTSDCFRGDWFDLTEDHTPGDKGGNMMVVNASYFSGPFLSTTVNGFKAATTYQLGVWMMNLCRITDKCPFPLLPNITMQLETTTGKIIARLNIGELQRLHQAHWTQYLLEFTTPPSVTSVRLVMADNARGGCGNDFALDDITFRECLRPVYNPIGPSRTTKVKQNKTPAPTHRKPVAITVKPKAKNPPLQNTVVPEAPPAPSRPLPVTFPPAPSVLTNRTSPLIKQIETPPGEIQVDLYDNGEIDGDTITVYHNNELLVSHAGLTAKPIRFHITVDAAHPHHELVMVADNLGSIPPNTSLMIVTAGDKKYEVFISSTEQKNAKVTVDLKQ